MKKNINVETIINFRRIKGFIIFIVVILILLGIAAIFTFFVRDFDEKKQIAPTTSEENQIKNVWTQNTMFLDNTLNLFENTSNINSIPLTINNFTWIKSRPIIKDIKKPGGEFYWNNNDNCIDLYLNFVVSLQWKDDGKTPVKISILYSKYKATLQFISDSKLHTIVQINSSPLPVFSPQTKNDWLDASKLYTNLTKYLTITFTSEDSIINPDKHKYQTATFNFREIQVTPGGEKTNNYVHQLNHYLLHDLILKRLWFSDANLTTHKNVYGAPVNFVSTGSMGSNNKPYYETKIRENQRDSGKFLLTKAIAQKFTYLSQYIIAYNTWKYWDDIKYFSKPIK